jgi:hypothetical protein
MTKTLKKNVRKGSDDMTLTIFNRYKNRKSLVISKESANELLHLIDNNSDDITPKFGEYYTYKGVKIFTNQKPYALYQKYLENIRQ